MRDPDALRNEFSRLPASGQWPAPRDEVLLSDGFIADVTGFPFHWVVNLQVRQRLGIPFCAPGD